MRSDCYRVSFAEDGKVLKLDDGNGFTILYTKTH
jgi:hypothetical protein